MAISMRSAAAAALLLLAVAGPADAQGKGRGLGKGKNTPAQPPGDPEAPSIPGTGIRHFGAWLDDATLLPPWKGWMSFGVGYWKSSFGHQWDAPSMDAGMGLTNRLQVAVFAPVSRIEYTDGSEIRGLGDVYVATKIGLITPGENDRPWGVAAIPILEILSSGSVQEGSGRVHWGLPLTFEYRFSGARFYGSGGYFSRGAVFGAGALEVPIGEKFMMTGSLSHSRSLEEDLLADALELSRSRWDLTGTALYILNPSVTVYASVGRTISRFDENASSLAVSAGASGGFQGRRVRR
jgi:hypothetical protein